MPPPNIMAAYRLGPAWAAPEVLPVLRVLGLVESGQWTAAAELSSVRYFWFSVRFLTQTACQPGGDHIVAKEPSADTRRHRLAWMGRRRLHRGQLKR